jgi:hypothetical protein
MNDTHRRIVRLLEAGAHLTELRERGARTLWMVCPDGATRSVQRRVIEVMVARGLLTQDITGGYRVAPQGSARLRSPGKV